MHDRPAAVADQASERVLPKQAHVAIADARRAHDAGTVEEGFGALFLHVVIDGIAGRVEECFTTCMRIHQQAQLYAGSKFPAVIAVLGIQYKTQFYRCFDISRYQFEFFEMRGISTVGERQGRSLRDHVGFRFVELDVITAQSESKPHTETLVGFEWQVEHEINIDAAGKALCFDGIGQGCPAGISQLKHEMVVGAVVQSNFAPVFFLVFGRICLGRSGGCEEYYRKNQREWFHVCVQFLARSGKRRSPGSKCISVTANGRLNFVKSYKNQRSYQ